MSTVLIMGMGHGSAPEATSSLLGREMKEERGEEGGRGEAKSL